MLFIANLDPSNDLSDNVYAKTYHLNNYKTLNSLSYNNTSKHGQQSSNGLFFRSKTKPLVIILRSETKCNASLGHDIVCYSIQAVLQNIVNIMQSTNDVIHITFSILCDEQRHTFISYQTKYLFCCAWNGFDQVFFSVAQFYR